MNENLVLAVALVVVVAVAAFLLSRGKS